MGCGASAQNKQKQRYEPDGTEPVDMKNSEFERESERHDLEGSHARANYSPPGSDAGGAGAGNGYEKSNVYDSAGGSMSGDPNATTRTGIMERPQRSGVRASYRQSRNANNNTEVDGGST